MVVAWCGGGGGGMWCGVALKVVSMQQGGIDHPIWHTIGLPIDIVRLTPEASVSPCTSSMHTVLFGTNFLLGPRCFFLERGGGGGGADVV